MFPRLRLLLFDANKFYSAPDTVFGKKLAILYIGKCYLPLREQKRVSALTDHFD